MSNFINSLRDSTIQEYLHSDRNRSSFLAHQIKNSVARFEGAFEPEKYEQIDELEMRNTNATVNELKQKLLDTFNNLNTLYTDNIRNDELFEVVQCYRQLHDHTDRLQQADHVVFNKH